MPFLDFFYVSLLCSTLVLSSHQIGIIIGNLTLLNTNSLLNTDNIHPVGASMGLTMMTVWENSDLLGNGESLYFSLYTLGLWSPGVLILGTAGASQAAIVSSSSSYYLAYTSSSATIQLTTTVAGVLWTPPVTFPQMFTSIQNQYPSLALDNANNQLVLVWQAHVSGLSNSDILFSRSNDGGVTWSNTTVLNSNALSSPYSNINPFVLCTTPSHWLVVWSSNDPINGTGPDFDIFYSLSVDGGQIWSSAAILNTNAQNDTGDDLFPHIANSGLNVTAVWSSNDTIHTQGAGDFDIFVSYSQDGGNTWLPVTVLNANAAVDNGDDFDPRIIIHPLNGISVAVWTSNATMFTTPGFQQRLLIYSLQSNTEPFVWTYPSILNPYAYNVSASFTEANPSLLLTPSSDFLTLWNSNIPQFLGQTLTGQNIFALDYTATNIVFPPTTNESASPSALSVSPSLLSPSFAFSPSTVSSHEHTNNISVSSSNMLSYWVIIVIVVGGGVLVFVAILIVVLRVRAARRRKRRKEQPPDLRQVDLTLHYLASKYSNDHLSASQSTSNRERKDERTFKPHN
jgi:hypothetical protein